MGEVAMIFAFSGHNLRQSDEMVKRLSSSPTWTEDLAVSFNALRKAWGIPEDTPVDQFWAGFVLHATPAAVQAAVLKQAHVRLILINDKSTCLIAGVPSQCQAVIAELGCPANEVVQNMVGHCPEVEPFGEAISAIHDMLVAPACEDLELLVLSQGQVRPLQPDEDVSAHIASLYTQVADFPAVVEEMYARGYRVFVELGAANDRTNAIDSILGDREHVAVAVDQRGKQSWPQMLKMLAVLMSHGGTGAHVRGLGYHTEQQALAGVCVKQVSINGSFCPDTPLLPKSGPLPAISKPTRQRGQVSDLQLREEVEYQMQQAAAYKGPLVWDYADLLQYAEGDLQPVFDKLPSGEHPSWALVDGYRRRVRLPQREYLLCSRVTHVEATTLQYEPCTMITEYDVPVNGALTEGAEVPLAVLVEAGQCDLMLISYLGIDFHCQGDRVYRLLDTTLSFFGVAHEGDTLRYHISINGFAKQEGNVSMFFFSYDCYVIDKHTGAEHLMVEMRNGVAGFFTDEELAAGKGVLRTAKEYKQRAAIVKRDPTPFRLVHNSKSSFSQEDMHYLCDQGHQGWGPVLPLASALRYKLCAEKILMIDRITLIDPTGGLHGLGRIVGEKLLQPDHWYFPCHFKGDQVMAGSLVSDGCSQMLKVYMVWLGLTQGAESPTFRPIVGVENKVRCRGQISPHRGKLVYVMDITDIGYTESGPYIRADVDIIDVNEELGQSFDLAHIDEYGNGQPDRKIVVDFKSIAMQLENGSCVEQPNTTSADPLLHPFPLPPAQFMQYGPVPAELQDSPQLCTWHPLAGVDGNPTPGFTPTELPPRPIAFVPFPNNPNDDNHTPGQLPLSWYNMCEFMCHEVSQCLGEEFKRFDKSTTSRSPAFDLQLVTRVLSVSDTVSEGGPFYGVDVDPSKGTMVAEFDCPADAWFFEESSNPSLMPYSILMEISLQTSGILTSWVKAPLTMDKDNILFRNLDASARLLRSVDLRGKTITNTSRCTGYNMLGDMGIHRFKCELAVDGQVFYEVDTSFGWFLPEVFEKQTGLDNGAKVDPWYVQQQAPLTMHPFGAAVPGHQLHRQGARTQFLDQGAALVDAGKHGAGYAFGSKQVDVQDWFFSCHFWCDPVMPGSLGIESMYQLIELFCVESELHLEVGGPACFEHELGQVSWKYRGQLTRRNSSMHSEVHIVSVQQCSDGSVVVIAEGNLYVDQLRVYSASGLRVRLVPAKLPIGSSSAAVSVPASAAVPAVLPQHSTAGVSVADLDAVRAVLQHIEVPCTVSGVSVPSLPPADLGNPAFMEQFGTSAPLMTGAMAKGVASAELVIAAGKAGILGSFGACLLYTSPSPRDRTRSRMPSSA
eukprot:TRINITY_DN1204_c0_g1_i7.p1 TRINITY_DN1204_c0_g1~~TRINITY_DN1204_c0_g1_i7.p1  ORF type:complete len:1346 (-),score=500.43 TRINITY_DN1204_c0_g1_i7:17-4054(-)